MSRVGEGALLSRLFSLPMKRSVFTMILANYLSAWFGGLLLSSAIWDVFSIDLNNGWKWFWGMVVITYCVTLVMEWPFIPRSLGLGGPTSDPRQS